MRVDKEGEEEKHESQRIGISEAGDDSTCIGLLKSEFKLSNIGLSYPRPQLFVSSQWGYSKLYLGWRLFWAVYHIVWLMVDWVNTSLTSSRPLTWPAYLTNWGFLLLAVDAVILGVLQLCQALKHFREEGLWYLKAAWLLYVIASNSAVLITVLFFALLFDGNWHLLSIVKHLLNTVYVLLDFCITATPIRLLHFVYPFTFATIYVTFSVVYWAAGGVNRDGERFIYKVLDWSSPEKAAPLALGLLVTAVPFTHILLWALYMLRVLLWNILKRKGDSGTSGRGDGGSGGGGRLYEEHTI